MIQLSGMPFYQNTMWPADRIESIIFQRMNDAPDVYSYQSISELLFEIRLRKNIIASARKMNDGDSQFEPFEKSRCNPQYWYLTAVGGFQLKRGALPSEAIRDIYRNSSLYAFECATAKMIIYYHAVLHSIGDYSFNRFFQNIYLYSWHANPALGIETVKTNYFLPGDVVYFNNPDFDPNTSWWRGENAVVLEDGTCFGHGLGIETPSQIIHALNKRRKPGSSQSAYLKQSATRPSFKQLEKLSLLPRGYNTHPKQLIIFHNKSSISMERYLLYLNKAYQQAPHIYPFM
ncbi:protein-glutamine gamma-glutamyltransferase [Pseudobacillus sp. FSL P4-0506]|uniref:protein-glutamine gamma-glutamyltransferase n=1 Tax=Pseudobacillus sp. FSL P4-0506 TaxID=2921576 RepID=UPI0030FA3EBB